MNWTKWKAGLLVSAFTGLLTGVTAYEFLDHIDFKKFGVFLVVNAAKDALLFMKSHPAPIEEAVTKP